MNLSSTIKSIQDIMRKDDGVDGDAQRIGQLTWMLFLKVFDQREEEWEASAEEGDQPYTSPLPEDCRWRNWATFVPGADGRPNPRIQASELIAFVNNTLFPKLKAAPQPAKIDSTSSETSEPSEIQLAETPMRKVIRQVFEDSNNYMKSGTLMLGVIEKLDEAIDFHDFTTRQNLGDIYEQILNDLRAAGNAGEFYTPRAITKVMVELVDPRVDRLETVMDPACGTGGFLTATIDHLTSQCPNPLSAEDKKTIEGSIVGIEKKQLPHLLCVTNLLLHGIDVPSQVDHYNTLARPWIEWDESDQVMCVITNPPFGGMEDVGVGSDFPPDFRTRETADMFLTLIVEKLLKDGGRGAIVLPDGFLFGDGIKARIKERLMEKCNLHTIIRLPNGVFAPYTGIKTNLLLFTKGKPTETLWFYEHPYPAGQRSYSKTKPIRLEEFDAERAWWGREEDDFAQRRENEYAWKVDFKTKKAVARTEAKPYWDEAEDLINQASAIENEIRGLRDSIKGVKEPEQRKPVEERIGELRENAEQLRIKSHDARAAGDRLYWPIYNLDIKNPNAPEEESHDPDVLLERYKRLLADIEETQEHLKNELGAALAHHFEHAGA
jgi:type I restriction enzyme M protein